MRRLRMWRYPFACEVITSGAYRFRVTWQRSKILHRRGRIIGIEMWRPAAEGSYAYVMWGVNGAAS